MSLICGGLFFAKKMRDSEFVTMLDPLQNKYGRTLGAVFYIPAFSGEVSSETEYTLTHTHTHILTITIGATRLLYS